LSRRHQLTACREITMDISIEQLSQDLARAGYANRTRCEYRKVAERLGEYFSKPIAEISRDELRQYVQTITEQTPSANNLSHQLCALLFLFRRTLGKPQVVSFIKLPWPAAAHGYCSKGIGACRQESLDQEARHASCTASLVCHPFARRRDGRTGAQCPDGSCKHQDHRSLRTCH